MSAGCRGQLGKAQRSVERVAAFVEQRSDFIIPEKRRLLSDGRREVAVDTHLRDHFFSLQGLSGNILVHPCARSFQSCPRVKINEEICSQFLLFIEYFINCDILVPYRNAFYFFVFQAVDLSGNVKKSL